MINFLYRDNDAPKQRALGNAGLWYNKFFNQWHSISDVAIPEEGKQNWVTKVADGNAVGNHKEIDNYILRMGQLLEQQKQAPLFYKLESDFVTGLGLGHPIENGFAWHHSLGTPYLPGSSIKGLVRHWAENWALPDRASLSKQEWRDYKNDFLRIFGSRLNDKEVIKSAKHTTTGNVIFFDALPTRPVTLKADIMTPHYSDYYQDVRGETAPSDWLSPNPIPFLALNRGATFLFAILPRSPQDEQALEDCKQAQEWLEGALEWLGAGAKTAVGYGRFTLDTKEQKEFAANRQKELEDAQQAQDLQQAIQGKSELFTTLYTESTEGKWQTERHTFTQDGLIEGWLDKLEAAPHEREAIEYFYELLQKHFADVLAEPDKVKGKKNKPVFKERQRKFAKRMLELMSTGKGS